MTFRQWTNVYGGTYATILLVAIAISTVVAGELAGHSLWLHLLIGLSSLVAAQFTLSLVAWQITERRRRKQKQPGQAQQE